MAEGLHSDQEVAHDHGRAKMRPVVERLLAYTLEIDIARLSCLFARRSERSHRTLEAEQRGKLSVGSVIPEKSKARTHGRTQ